MGGKRGGMIAEAAIVFPVVILSLIAIITILIRMYVSMSESIHEHLALRIESGIRTNTVIQEEGYQRLIPGDRYGKSAFRRAPEIYDAKKLIDNYIFTGHSRCYVIDEVLYIRQSDFLKNIMGNNEEDFE